MLYGVFSLLGERRVTLAMTAVRNGDPATAFIRSIEANAVFPLPYYVREANASMMAMAQWVPPDVAAETIGNALANDPYSGNLLWYAAINEMRRGRMDEARAFIDRLQEVGSGWPQTANAEAVYAEAKKHFDAQGKPGG